MVFQRTNARQPHPRDLGGHGGFAPTHPQTVKGKTGLRETQGCVSNGTIILTVSAVVKHWEWSPLKGLKMGGVW